MAIKRNCFCCNKKLKGLYTNIEDPPYDAVSFSSDGKYGSSIFDPYEENARIEIYICDECLKKKAKLSYYYELEQKIEIKNIQSFDKKLKQVEAIIKERTKKLIAAVKKFKRMKKNDKRRS